MLCAVDIMIADSNFAEDPSVMDLNGTDTGGDETCKMHKIVRTSFLSDCPQLEWRQT